MSNEGGSGSVVVAGLARVERRNALRCGVLPCATPRFPTWRNVDSPYNVAIPAVKHGFSLMVLAVPSPHGRQSLYPKPVIGIAGGIGAGKSLVARMFEDLGGARIDSDADAHAVLNEPEVRATLVSWWGSEVLDAQGQVCRRAVAARVFGRPEELNQLNQVVHPRVKLRRDQAMQQYVANPRVLSVVWDTPLLYEVGLAQECDVVVFVNVPRYIRLQRIIQTRGWSEAELEKREKLQFPLDKKAELADYSVDNGGEVTATLRQVRDIFSQILSRKVASSDHL